MQELIKHLPSGKDASVLQISDKEYRGSFGLSQSSIKDFLKSPAHYLESTRQISEPTDAMQFGTAFHAVMLQDNPSEHYAVSRKFDRRKTEDKIAAEKFEQENIGKAIINSEQETVIKEMHKAVLAHKRASQLHKAITRKEFSVYGTLTFADDVRLKGLIDGYCDKEGYIVDYKSCVDASPKGARKAIKDLRYDIQNIQYLWLLTNAGLKVNKFYFVFVEKTPPYAVGVYSIPAKSLMYSLANWVDAVSSFSVCQTTGNYPAYSEDEVELEIYID